MGEKLRFEESPRNRLSDEIGRLRCWLNEHRPYERAENVITSVKTALREYEETIMQGVPDSEFLRDAKGEISRLENEVRIKEANRQLDNAPKGEMGDSEKFKQEQSRGSEKK